MVCKEKKDVKVWKVRKMLISVNVQGSTGPIRFIVSEEEVVMKVIAKALKIYARVGRLPVLGCDISDFLLYSPMVGSQGQALRPWERIGSVEGRNFVLYKKTQPKHQIPPNPNPNRPPTFKACFNHIRH